MRGPAPPHLPNATADTTHAPDYEPGRESGRAPDLQASRPQKRSFAIAGHKTSISLEAAFWDAFRELCEADGVSMATQIAQIDRQRGDAAGLSGTVRVWILQRYRRALIDNPAIAADAAPASAPAEAD